MFPAIGCETAMVAVIVAVPAVTAVAAPMLPAVLLMVATPVLEELQVTIDVRSCVVPPENVPVALNCWVPPTATVGLAGWTAIELSVAEETVKVVEATTFPDVAEIVVEPAATAVATPLVPAVLLMVAAALLVELQVTEEVRSCVVLSEKVPMAVNCWEVSRAMVGFAGWIVILTSVSAVTVKVVEVEAFPIVAVIVVVPAETAVADPLLPAVLLMVATPVLKELQATDEVKSCVVPSENVPVAANC
jgi:hypothetical protein